MHLPVLSARRVPRILPQLMIIHQYSMWMCWLWEVGPPGMWLRYKPGVWEPKLCYSKEIPSWVEPPPPEGYAFPVSFMPGGSRSFRESVGNWLRNQWKLMVVNFRILPEITGHMFRTMWILMDSCIHFWPRRRAWMRGCRLLIINIRRRSLRLPRVGW